VTALLLASLLLAAPASAAPPPRWTPEDYVRAVLASAPELERSRAEDAAARARLRAAWADAALPRLSFSAKAYPYGHNPSDADAFRRWGLAHDQVALASSLNWNIIDLTDEFKVREARLARDGAQSSLATTLQERSLEALKTYFGLWFRRRTLEVQRGNLAMQEEQYALTQDLYKHGMKSYADLLKSETDLLSARLRTAAAEAGARRGLLDFDTLLRAEPDAPAELLSEFTPPVAPSAELSADLRTALARRSELAGARAALEKAVQRRRRAIVEAFPSLSLDAQWQRSDPASFGGRYAAAPPNPRYRLALELALPSGFNFVSQEAAAAVAAAERRSAAAGLDERERLVRAGVVTARIELERSLAVLAVAERKTQISKESLDLVTEQYQQGRADIIRLGQAQLDSLNAQTERAQALHDAMVSQAEYRFATGEPL
jgi:outer membrane protein TolC